MSALVLAFADSRQPAGELAARLSLPVNEVAVHRFPDNEACVRVPGSARTVILFRSLNDPDAKLVELILAASAARDLGAERVILVAPYLAYMRQDMAFRPGEAISQQVVGRLLAAHFDALVTVDPHLHRIAALVEAVPGVPAISLTAAALLGSAIDAADRPVIVGPDSESRQWAAAVAAPLRAELLIGEKQRRGDRDVSLAIPGIETVRDRLAVLVDDMVSSGRTLIEAAQMLRAAGARDVQAVVTHCLASAADLDDMHAQGLTRVSSTDSIAGPTARVPLAGLLADALREPDLLGAR